MAEKLSKQTIELEQSKIDVLRDIAKRHGLLVGRGPYAKDGSIKQLNEAIASGRLVVVESDYGVLQ